MGPGYILTASSFDSYFNFTQHGPVDGGSQITSNVYGNATATVNSPATTLNSSGLAITAEAMPALRALPKSPATRPAHGDFGFQIQFTSPSTIHINTALFGGTTSATIDSSLPD